MVKTMSMSNVKKINILCLTFFAAALVALDFSTQRIGKVEESARFQGVAFTFGLGGVVVIQTVINCALGLVSVIRKKQNAKDYFDSIPIIWLLILPLIFLFMFISKIFGAGN